MSRTRSSIVVVGSVNLDLVARAPRLPVAGETVTGATFARYPGGKGANQALAARRLGAAVALCARTGRDAFAEEALALLRAGGVDLSAVGEDTAEPTGVALIAVGAGGENQIVVAPGANHRFTPGHLKLPAADALICQLELPIETVSAAAERFPGFVCINLAPARDVPAAILRRADLIVMNETEAAYFGDAVSVSEKFVAITRGAAGAELLRGGNVIATATPPAVEATDTTGAGDTFTAALTVGLIEGMTPGAALEFACAAGALATTRPGAQPALPFRDKVHRVMDRTAGAGRR